MEAFESAAAIARIKTKEPTANKQPSKNWGFSTSCSSSPRMVIPGGGGGRRGIDVGVPSSLSTISRMPEKGSELSGASRPPGASASRRRRSAANAAAIGSSPGSLINTRAGTRARMLIGVCAGVCAARSDSDCADHIVAESTIARMARIMLCDEQRFACDVSVNKPHRPLHHATTLSLPLQLVSLDMSKRYLRGVGGGFVRSTVRGRMRAAACRSGRTPLGGRERPRVGRRVA